MKIRILFFLPILFLYKCMNNPSPKGGIIATNAWTAAYAMAAGVDNVIVLAPYEMVHPSEYEMRAGDIARIENAELLIYAGYESMIGQIKNGLNLTEEKMLAIATSYNYEEIEQSVMEIAKKQKTEETARKNLKEIKELLEYSNEVFGESGLDTVPALVHFFQQSFALETGLNVIKIFGPAPPEPKQILDLTRTGAALIIDNAHNPVGGPVKETLKNAKYVEMLNFPGLHGTRTLADVIKFNVDQIVTSYE